MPLIISVFGGVVQAVFSGEMSTDVSVVDWDVQAGDRDVTEVLSHGRTLRACVIPLSVQPISALAGSDVAAVVQAAPLLNSHGHAT